eukprot:7876-Prymnesium_polylepis.1
MWVRDVVQGSAPQSPFPMGMTKARCCVWRRVCYACRTAIVWAKRRVCDRWSGCGLVGHAHGTHGVPGLRPCPWPVQGRGPRTAAVPDCVVCMTCQSVLLKGTDLMVRNTGDPSRRR